ncbi:MAG: DUF2306 domain-containing protein [Candidatus Sumerlaeia bacterium]|nr:DUF2306 domain-containing protein [Candidatus Sumerlaeia bacterium]
MKSRPPSILLVLLVVMSLITAIRSIEYITGDMGAFDIIFREKYASMMPLLITHGSASILALGLGAILLLPMTRRWHPLLHRMGGRVYLVAVLVGALTGFFMGLRAFGGASAQVAFCLLAILWIYTGWRAYTAARRRDIDSHRAWMIRNFSLTFAAVTLRLYIQALPHLGLYFEHWYATVAWLSWTLNLAVAELIVRWQDGTIRALRGYFSARSRDPVHHQ